MHTILFFFLNTLEILTNLCPFAQNGAQALVLQGEKVCQQSALGAVAQYALVFAESALCQQISGH